MNRRLRAVSLLFLVTAFAARAAADDDTKAEAVSRVEEAKPLAERGSYFDAIATLRKAVAADPANVDAAILLARCLGDTGEYAKAAETLVPFTSSAPAQTLLAELRLTLGDETAAAAAAAKALELDAKAVGALVVTGRVHELNGRRDEAIAAYEEADKRWAATKDAEETDDVLIADARARLGVFRLSADHRKDLESVLSRLEIVIKRSPHRVDALVECGDLYLASYKDQEAKKWYSKALDRNPNYAPALFGKARQMAFRFDDEEAARLCDNEVLREGRNPSYVPALLHMAQQALGDGDFPRADGYLRRALAVSPSNPETRATHAAMLFLRGDTAAFEAEVAEMLAKDRFASKAYSVAAAVTEEQRRFDEALLLAEKAVNVDPLDWDAQFLAGRNALNVGDDAKGEKYLAAAEKGDPYANVFRRNFIKLFEATRNFTVAKDARFVVRIPPEESEPYLRLLRRTMGESIDALEAKWGFRMKDPLYVSVFDQQADFATRTIGLPGFPALGACFGQVVTLDSPRALPAGAFLWNSTQHHELAHVITLQLSKGRVPRWLTEGASVYEERKARASWNREDERNLIDAIASDEVLTLKDINGAFRGPRVLFAYYQGGLMCEFIERDFGFPKLRELVASYADGLDTPEAVKRVLGISAEEFDGRFLAYAKEFVAPYKVFRRPSKAKTDRLARAMRKTPNDLEGWILLTEGALARGDVPSALSSLLNASKLAPDDGRVVALRALAAWRENKSDIAVKHAESAIAKGADYYELRMGLAEHFVKRPDGAETAKTHWRRAIELFPLDGTAGDPRLLLAAQLAAEGEQNVAEVAKLLRAHADVNEEDFVTRRKLATIYAQQGAADDELLMYEEMRDVVPLPNVPPPNGRGGFPRDDAIALHRRLAEIYLERKRYADAELAAACAVGVSRMDLGTRDGPFAVASPPTTAELLVVQAQALALLGRADESRARAAEALRLDPSNDDAKALANPQ